MMCILALSIASPIAADMAPTSFMTPPELEVQQEVTDQELVNFGVALIEVQEIQIKANEEINHQIEDSELSIERLDEIFSIQQQNPEELKNETSKAELEEFNHVIDNITSVQQETETKIVDSLAEHSYDIESFNEMAAKIQEDPELLDRLQTLFDSQQEEI
jgi:TolA-binding protein